MPMQQKRPAERLERQVESLLLRGLGQIFLKQHGVLRERGGIAAPAEGWNLVAKAEHATRLEADHGNAARDKRCECGNAALCLAPCLIDQSDGQEGSPAAEWTPGARFRLRQIDQTARRREHRERGPDILGLEI